MTFTTGMFFCFLIKSDLHFLIISGILYCSDVKTLNTFSVFASHKMFAHPGVIYRNRLGGDALGSVRIKNKTPADSGAVDLG